MKTVNLADKFGLIQEYWKPKIVAELNDSYVKLAKIKGEFVWHHHKNEDEMFLVIQGNLVIRIKDGEDIQLTAGELAIIPKGVEHMPVTAQEVQILLLEPKTTRNTGNLQNERTTTDEWI